MADKLIILGIDPGSIKTGWGVIERVAVGSPDFVGDRVEEMDICTMHYEYKTLKWGTIKPPPDLSGKAGLPQRLYFISNAVSLLVGRFMPDVVAIEKGFGGVNQRTTLVMGETLGAILVGVQGVISPYHKPPKIYEYAPTQVKKTVCGKGNAKKYDVSRAVWCLLNCPEEFTSSADESDALAVALTCAIKEW